MRVRTHANPLSYYERMKPIAFSKVFPDYSGKLDLEIGFGRGIFLRHYAQRHPNRSVLGVEVRKQIVEILQERVDELELKNVCLVHGTAQILMEDLIADEELERVFVFHPDPWFKKRHHNRRVINPLFMKELKRCLAPGGRLYISTDVTPLWEAMSEMLIDCDWLKPVEDNAFWSEDYLSHWADFSERDKRDFNSGVFEKVI